MASKKPDGLKRCDHTSIVGLGVLGEHFEKCMGVDGEGDRSKDVGTGKAEWDAGGERKMTFTKKILRLMKVIGVLRFPVNPVAHLSPRADKPLVGGSEIPCHESVCAECGLDYDVLVPQDAIAVRQVRHFPVVGTDLFRFVLGSLFLWLSRGTPRVRPPPPQ